MIATPLWAAPSRHSLDAAMLLLSLREPVLVEFKSGFRWWHSLPATGEGKFYTKHAAKAYVRPAYTPQKYWIPRIENLGFIRKPIIGLLPQLPIPSYLSASLILFLEIVKSECEFFVRNLTSALLPALGLLIFVFFHPVADFTRNVYWVIFFLKGSVLILISCEEKKTILILSQFLGNFIQPFGIIVLIFEVKFNLLGVFICLIE